jgi:hypothetical protein
MLASVFRAQMGISAVLDNFDFDARFQVISFDITFKAKRSTDLIGPLHSNSAFFKDLPPEGARYQSTQALPGDRVYIENIKAVGPDKTIRSLGSINLLLQ